MHERRDKGTSVDANAHGRVKQWIHDGWKPGARRANRYPSSRFHTHSLLSGQVLFTHSLRLLTVPGEGKTRS